MAKSRVTHHSQTATYQFANGLAQFPRVEDTAQVDLRYSTKFYEQTHRGPKPKGFLRKALELFNPYVWTPAFWFALITSAAMLFLSYSGIQFEVRGMKAPLYPAISILTALRITFSYTYPLTLLVLHLCLNYRRRSPGRLIKAYWYASWMLTICLGTSTAMTTALNQLHANQLNEYCFANKNAKKCERYAKRVFKSISRKKIFAMMPERKRLALEKTYYDLRKAEQEETDTDSDETKPAKKVAAAKKAPASKQRVARSLENSRRLAYGH